MPRPRSLRSQALSPRRENSRPPSPTFSEATNASVLNFGPDGPSKIITRAHLKNSIQGYEDLLTKCAAYRSALMTMSRATAGFADAMGSCAGLKGPTYESGTRMQAASGLHHLMSNHFHVLAETLDKQFEKPLRQHLENYRSVVTERSNTYERALREKSNIIRETEMGNLKKKGRNLQTFREALTILQRQVDELDELKAQHYEEIIDHEEEVWDFVQGKVCLAVRSTMDVFDRLTSKASDPVIEPMLQTVPDPFDSYGPAPAEDQIFTILQPLSVIANAPSTSSTASPLTASTPDLEGSDGGPSNNSSWAPTTGGFFPDASAAWADVASPATSPPRSRTISTPVSPARSASPQAVDATVGASPPSHGRRHSYPAAPSASTSGRKSESKLRSVLSVIDESHPRPNGQAEEPPDMGEADLPGNRPASPTLNGKGRADADSQWATFSFPHAYSASTSSDVTPRNSTFISGISPSVTPQGGGTPRVERSRSPLSDDTAIPITT
ncbi:uncharacterized protein B0H18DRAFT_1081107 [Fomitopsis serialis]|uniref:uncharacterized protein n=1 Tax=Fomitopsis serialis TaxID=139415 RepID=UPI0020072735|nr:uncharacterized protein B0H18DRAFT_1081107 [Neoantrodia serialis]KAH9938439.1 hypothetical protein B0H18DRAFT_1081107 [Neoantrodia serialis]